MNEIQLQKDVLSLILKKKQYSIMYYKDYENNTIWVGFDGVRLYALDMFKFFIDVEAAECREFKGIKQILENQNDGYWLKLTNELHCNGKTTCIKLHCDNFDCYVNKDFFKPFKELNELKFKSVGSKGMIFVFEYDRLAAILCPVNIRKENN